MHVWASFQYGAHKRSISHTRRVMNSAVAKGVLRRDDRRAAVRYEQRYDGLEATLTRHLKGSAPVHYGVLAFALNDFPDFAPMPGPPNVIDSIRALVII
jgi:hypothetical protein